VRLLRPFGLAASSGGFFVAFFQELYPAIRYNLFFFLSCSGSRKIIKKTLRSPLNIKK
jgi:hypothetical protein